ncbi:MAG TPA: hypothetical protein PK413_00980 [Thermoanaerobaculia bacterium]|nr:hypothetical protein [Thermoanaerobaculia bacterium]
MSTAEERLTTVLRLFQGSIRAAGRTQTEVDELIGRRRGYLSHVFQRRVDLKLIDLLQGLAVLNVDPHRFFQLAFSSEADKARSSVLIECFTSPEGQEALRERSAARINQDVEVLDRVRRAIREILSEGTPGARLPPLRGPRPQR